MRLDKFLKVSRLIKRRSVAKDVCDQGRVQINDKVAKASTNVAPGDLVAITYGNRIVTVRVDELLETTKKSEAHELYDLVSEEPIVANEDKDE